MSLTLTEVRHRLTTSKPQPWNRGFAASGLGAVCSAVILAQIILLAVVGLQSAVPLERLFRDTIAVAEEYPGCCHVYDGLVSNLGILIWWASACVAGFAALFALRNGSAGYEVRALIIAAVFSAWLTADDFFMLHESVLPRIGLPQAATYAIYGGIAAAYVALGWRVIFAAAPLYLLMAIGMLGASAFVDILADHDLGAISAWLRAAPRIELLLDDGFKFLGIGFWFCLHLGAAMRVSETRGASGSARRTAHLVQGAKRTTIVQGG